MGDINDVYKEFEMFYNRNNHDSSVKRGLSYFFDHPIANLNKKRVSSILNIYKRRFFKLPESTFGKNMEKKIVLDLCCGTGFISMLLAKYGGCSVLGVDGCKESIEIAAELSKKMNIKNVKFLEKDVYELDIPSRSQDVIIMAYALHHLSKPELILNKTYKMLKPDGILIINEENKSSPTFQLKNFIRSLIQKDTHEEKHLSCTELENLFQKQGFKLLTREGIDYLPAPLKYSWSIVFSLQI